ncbi:DUF7065 domain-containing protein [Nocardia neocaledoniensis]|uniref:DUF7065 domain-containing protein n=1 Tax=Nocardia neocaledoniensis TaxID=236511 RepID=UPI0024560AA4|nr:hypothetical protein [Nocardia neocaledoniensis]
MTLSDALRPAHLSNSAELTNAVEAVELWSENYLSYVWSPANEVGVYMHFNRPPFNPRLWHDIFIVYLPNDRFLVAKGFTPEDEPGVRGPKGAGLDWTCDEPWVQWTKRFEGAVQHVTGDELRSGALRDGIHTSAKMELVYRQMGPVFGVGSLDEQDWATDHYEQHCTVTGWIEHEGTRYEVNGTGLRDHSWGPRDLSRMADHVWLHGQFPSGRTFMTIVVRNRSGSGHLMYHLVSDADGKLREAKMSEIPLISDNSQPLDPYTLQFELADGTVETIKAEVLTGCPIALVGQSEMAYGIDTRAETSHTLWECLARFEWDGEIGYGLSERTVMH